MDLEMGIKKSGAEEWSKKGKGNREGNRPVDSNNDVIITKGAILVLDDFNVKLGITLKYIFQNFYVDNAFEQGLVLIPTPKDGGKKL